MNEKTTISLGFKADTAGVDQAGRKIHQLKREFDSLHGSVKRVSTATTASNLAMAGGKPVPLKQQFEALHGTPKATELAIRKSMTGRGGVPSVANRPSGAMSVRGGRGVWNAAKGMMSTGINTAGMMNLGKSAVGGAMGLGAAGMGALGVGLGAAMIAGKGLQMSKEYMGVMGPLAKQLSMVGRGQKEFSASIRATSETIGVAQNQLIRYTQAYTNLAGAQDGRTANQIATIGGFAKGMGMEQGSTIQQMGGLAKSGVYGQNGGMRMNEFAALIAEAVSTGGMKGRESELLSSINSLVNVQLQTLTRPTSVSDTMSAMTALNRSGQPGLMGANGANILGKMNSGIQNPGGGDFGQMMMYQMLGGGDFYDFKMQQEKGIGGGNLVNVMGAMRKNFEDPMARYYGYNQMFGISMHQAQGLEGAMDKAGPDKNAFVERLNKITGNDLSKISSEKYGILAELDKAGPGAGAMEVMKDSRLESLKGQFNETTPIQEIMEAVIKVGLKATNEEKTVTELTKIENTIQDIGDSLILPIMEAVEDINFAIQEVKKGFSWLINNDERVSEDRSFRLSDEQKAAMAGAGPEVIKGLIGSGSQVTSGLKTSAAEISEQSSESLNQVAVGLFDLPKQLKMGFDDLITNMAAEFRAAIHGGPVGNGTGAKAR
ncbi:MAG: hypothetical protein JEZ11_24535 [Desulfobacterales bacterium]|nr:hypothetical protein [Desulfobacterales bacterium]